LFTHQPYNFVELPRTEIDGQRHYITPEGNCYPSVTTILSSKKSEGLQQWIDSVGPEAANRRKTQGANRGTAVHSIYEDYVNNKLKANEHNPITLDLFRTSESYLREGLELVHNLEFQVYSDRLKTAGTADMLCRFRGQVSILDYKTSFKPKREEWIEDYFIQETAYAMMVYERVGLVVPQIVTFIINEVEPEPQIFVKPTSEYIDRTLKFFKNYHKNILN
jgi:ATP-dependent exoDNAse (exonuclease V) beta subunit